MLVDGTKVLRKDSDLITCHGVVSLDLSLARRTAEQVEWLRHVEENPRWLQLSAPPAAKSDREVVFASVAQDGDLLEHASQELRADREVVLAAIKWDSLALRHASQELRADREFMLAAVANNGDALKHASEELRLTGRWSLQQWHRHSMP